MKLRSLAHGPWGIHVYVYVYVVYGPRVKILWVSLGILYTPVELVTRVFIFGGDQISQYKTHLDIPGPIGGFKNIDPNIQLFFFKLLGVL